MEFETWWLLVIPLFFFVGWISSRIDLRQLRQETKTLPETYFEGLNFLLNEEKDKAIDSLVALANADQESVELQLLVASFFRQRGELQRAIAIHKSLLDRSFLQPEQRLRCTFEIGLDYYKAGVLDRAEQSLLKVNSGTYQAAALEALEAVYVSERQWEKAISAANDREGISSSERGLYVAHYLCEIGDSLFESGIFGDAEERYLNALVNDGRCVRACISLGLIERRRGNPEKALEYWTQVEERDERFTILVSAKVLEVFTELRRRLEGFSALKRYFLRSPSPELLTLLVAHCETEDELLEVRQLVKEQFTLTKSIMWVEFLLQDFDFPEKRKISDELEFIRGVLRTISGNTDYGCTSCGFRAKVFHWQCPACGDWQTLVPSNFKHVETIFG